jgi:TonB family protein
LATTTNDNVETVDLSDLGPDTRVIDCTYPVYPAEPGADWEELAVNVTFIVDASGAVSEARAIGGPEKFREIAVTAVKQWKFQPPRKGKPVALQVKVPFHATGTPKRSISADYELTQVHSPETRPPGDPYNSEPLYPAFLESRRLSGDVELLLGINEEGRVDGVKVLRAFHPDFLTAALETVAAWECRPAQQGLLAVRAKKGVVLSFYTTGEDGRSNQADWMERNGIFLREPAGRKIVEYFEAPVEAVRMVDPVYPYELALAGTRGGARVDFRIDAYGRVGEVAVAEATHPEFGQALAAAITAWQFRPLRRFDEDVAALFSITWRFEEPRANSEEQRLLAGLAGSERPISARELDRPLFPLFQRPAVFPPDRLDAGEGGRAEIEFIIDRTGRVRLPRMRGATDPAFGWAAMTGLSQWLFETPRKNGQPVDVRVAIPMEFTPPERPAQPADAIKRPELDDGAKPAASVP